MHCPQCGLEQAIGETRFCRACGFELEDVKQLVLDKAGERGREQRRNKAFNQGLGLMTVSLIFVIVMSLLKDLGLMPEIVMKAIAAVFVLAGIIRMFYPYVVDRNEKSADAPGLIATSVETTRLSLPPRHASLDDWSAPVADTAEPLVVPSVTEPTTRHLDKDGEFPRRGH